MSRARDSSREEHGEVEEQRGLCVCVCGNAFVNALSHFRVEEQPPLAAPHRCRRRRCCLRHCCVASAAAAGGEEAPERNE